MAKEIKTIGVLTSGGDAPGMNAAVRAIVRAGISKGYRMMGIQRGYNGLINGEVYEMNVRSVSEIIHRGGTILYTARCLEFKTKEGQAKGLARCKELGIDALVVIGGDGSYRGARELAHRGIPMIGLPGTIDNDIACTDYTIGYDTAMNTALEMIDKLRDTTQSHDRCSVVDVMGRNAGYIALNVAIASGAMAVLLPESACALAPQIASGAARAWAAVRCTVPDRLPVVDSTGRVVTIAGLSGHGFKFVPQLGEWAAQLVLGEEHSVDPRFALAEHMKRLAELGPYTGGGH